MATALIQPLTWELPYATGAAIKRKKKNINPKNYSQTRYNENVEVKGEEIILKAAREKQLIAYNRTTLRPWAIPGKRSLVTGIFNAALQRFSVFR